MTRPLRQHHRLPEAALRPEPAARSRSGGRTRKASTIPERLADLLEQWRYRPPARFDFILDLETFAFFNYQYILYGMGFKTDLTPTARRVPDVAAAAKLFAKIRGFADRATQDLPSHRDLIVQINRFGFDRALEPA
jgi:tryptophan halogenase